DNVGTGQVTRHPEEMRNVDEVAMQLLDQGAGVKISAGGGRRLKQRDGLEVCGKRVHLGDALRRADEYILIFVIKTTEGADDVAGVSADAELGHAPKIDGDFHELSVCRSESVCHEEKGEDGVFCSPTP